jgi:hypothetical protein
MRLYNSCISMTLISLPLILTTPTFQLIMGWAMISNVHSTTPWVYTQSPGAPYIPQSGVVRWYGSTQCLEVLDGLHVIPIPLQTVSLSASAEMNAVLNWAATKMAEEKKLDELCANHPGLAQVRDEFEVMLALVSRGNPNAV